MADAFSLPPKAERLARLLKGFEAITKALRDHGCDVPAVVCVDERGNVSLVWAEEAHLGLFDIYVQAGDERVATEYVDEASLRRLTPFLPEFVRAVLNAPRDVARVYANVLARLDEAVAIAERGGPDAEADDALG